MAPRRPLYFVNEYDTLSRRDCIALARLLELAMTGLNATEEIEGDQHVLLYLAESIRCGLAEQEARESAEREAPAAERGERCCRGAPARRSAGRRVMTPHAVVDVDDRVRRVEPGERKERA